MALLILGAILLATLIFGPKRVGASWEQISSFWKLEGRPEPASASVLSEHEIEALDQKPPQSQAELLLERSINHYRGANEEIERRVEGWRGNLTLEGNLINLITTAINSDDLRVRAAGIEVDLAGRNVEKTAASVDRLELEARSGEQAWRVNALWSLGLLGNRGVEPERVTRILLGFIHDSDEKIRYWAVDGLSYLGTDETIPTLLDVFHSDPSPNVRERAGCGLAQSGMLNERQRRSAVPKLLDFTDDPSLDAETRKWVFQALRDITGQSLPHDSAAWRNWYRSSADGEWHPVTRDRE
jgi:HEAT repeats